MKRILLLLILIIFVISISGCRTDRVPINNEVTEEKQQTVEEVVKEKVGSYLLFKTSKEYEYLNFLTNFDETKYEIVHISTFAHETSNSWNDDYFMITYKVIAE